MRLRRRIVTTAIVAGLGFTIMLSLMAYSTYPVAIPSIPTIIFFTSLVTLFWWIAGSMVADVIERDITRTVAAIRARVETNAALRRRMERQKVLLAEFARDTLPAMNALAEAARYAAQACNHAAGTEVVSALEQLQHLADECSNRLMELVAQAEQGQQHATALQQDLSAIAQREPQLAAQLQALERLAQQCNLLSLNAAIEATRAWDKRRGVGLLTEEMKQLASHAGTIARNAQEHSAALSRDAQASHQRGMPLAASVTETLARAREAHSLHDEQWEMLEELASPAASRSLPAAQLARQAETIRSRGLHVAQAFDGLLNRLSLAA